AEAIGRGDVSARGLAGYRRRLEETFVLRTHRKLRRVPKLILGERMQTRYPQLLCNLAEGAFTVTDPEPKPGLLRLARRQAKRDGVSLGSLAADGWAALRSFG